MSSKYLHEHPEFLQLLQIIAAEKNIDPYLVEKDYWIMHVLFGLKEYGFEFELKGGTSLSKGYKIIDRFSEDIDIHIKPLEHLGVNVNPKNTKPKAVASRKGYYDWLKDEIKINGIIDKIRDTEFDDKDYYRSGGIRLKYESKTNIVKGAKEGILLEAGFDTVTPNNKCTISSWAYDRAMQTPGIDITDNRAMDIACYHPGYTFVEKLQTIATKFRQEQTDKIPRQNLMRQYYDVYSLLGIKEVQEFIGTEDYLKHKVARFPKADFDIPIAKNEAFLLTNSDLRKQFIERYQATASLYYSGQPSFGELLARIKEFIDKL
jgi:predicted nucleotidyltransferase component of viral defense system